MIVLVTDEINSGYDLQHWQYNGLDCCVTYEVDEKQILPEYARKVYLWEQQQSIMALSMMLRGLRVDPGSRDKLSVELLSRYNRLEVYTQEMAGALNWPKPLNPRSPKQLIDFFYNHLKIPPIKETYRGITKIKTDRAALEKLCRHPHAGWIARTILEMRDTHGYRKVITTDVDADGKMRFTFNPAGTETGRWASRGNPISGGTQQQNITDEMRRIFVPDPGYFLCAFDLAQAESRGVAYYSNDPDYIRACESGDLHSTVCEMIWSGSNPKELFYRHLSRRDICKRAGHGSNYDGSPYGIAEAIGGGITDKLLAEFQSAYFKRFPGIKRWHAQVAQDLSRYGWLETVFGFRRQFFGRLWDDETRKQAIASLPQSTIAYYMNLGLWRIFNELDRGDPSADVQIVGQGHDSGLFQIREGREDLLPVIREMLDLPIQFPSGKIMRIPTDCSVGYNWGKELPENPNGLGKSLKGKRFIPGNILDAVL